MPRTFINSSTFLNGPFFWRYSTMSAAVLAPMPGSASKSAADAVLMLMGPRGAAAFVDDLPLGFPLVAAGGVDCAAVATVDWTAMNETAAMITSAIRNISILLVKCGEDSGRVPGVGR